MAAIQGADTYEISDVLKTGPFDLRRQAQIARAGPADHAGECVLLPNPNFNLDATIFTSLTGAVARNVIRDRLAVIPYWSDAACDRITRLFSAVPKPMPHDRSLLEFMDKECNFAMEHADGSFMDHLQFCYEYSVAHFKQHSPRVFLLHSILGVGTNYFPMELSKMPQLKALVSEVEMIHIKAFPSILRLLYHGPLLDELTAAADSLDQIESLTYHLVIDNQEVTIVAEDLWVQLNYQLIHMLDFLPTSDWEQNAGDNFLSGFARLHSLLSKSGKLVAHVDLGLKPIAPAAPGMAMPQPATTLGGVIRKYLPVNAQLAMAKKQIANFSALINHDLKYKLQWKSASSRL